MRRVLVTGGSGFIGSHVVDALTRRGLAPRIFDIRQSPHHAEGSVDTVIGDLLDTDVVRRAAEGCEAIIHLAAAADVGIVAQDPEAAEKLNARGTLSVLEAARGSGTRVIYGSTIWVYGEAGEGELTEDSPLGMPIHLYTATKLAGEMYCTSYAELYDVPYTILRFGIPYGPRARPAAVIPIFAAKAMAGDPLTIAGDGLQTRRFVYVEDLADGIARGFEEGGENRTYNLAGDDAVTILELAEIVRDATREVDIVHTPGRNGDFGGATISSARAAEELGWMPRTPIREGVRRYVSWAQREGAFDPEPEVLPGPAAPALPRRAAAGIGSLRRRVPFTAGPTFAACLVGLLIPCLLAVRTDEFGQGQAHTVAAMTLVAILGSLSLLPMVGVRVIRTGVIAAWSLLALLVLGKISWSNHLLALDKPSAGTVLLSAIGAVTAIAVATGWDAARNELPETASDRAG